MTAGVFASFAMAGQAAADALLAHLQREDPAAAEQVAEQVAVGEAGLSVALTIRGGEAWIELMLRTDAGVVPVASVPLRISQPARAN